MKTRKEVEELKRKWLIDPHLWNIEETEGFEEYREELLRFRKQKEQEWEEQREQKMMEYAKSLGLECNVKLAMFIKSLESRIDHLEELMDEIPRASLKKMLRN